MEKVVAIIQARMGSTRLPGKVMKKMFDRTVLSHVIERVKQSEEIDELVIATSILEQDEVISKEAIKCGVNYFRGSEEDVLNRYYYAAKENDAAIVVRITADCPLIDPIIIDRIINYYKDHSYNLVTNAGIDLSQRTYPRGLDTEVFALQDLEKAFYNAEESYQREHVTPYIYENNKNVYIVKNDVNYSDYRWTLDTKEDWELINKIYQHLFTGKHNFYFYDIVNLMEKYPKLKEINKNVKQKNLG